MPDYKDPCTLVAYDLSTTAYTDLHPNPACTSGGLVWYGTWGRIHLHFSLDNSTDSNFEVCLTGGFANGIFVWYNYRDKYWEPMGYPNFMDDLPRNESCRNSHRGILDVFVESPWAKKNYASFLTWEVQRHPPGWKDEEHAQHEDVITGFDKKEEPTQNEAEEGDPDQEEMEAILEEVKAKHGGVV